MRDVADKAGVSITSVSHVINQSRPVSEELQDRVQTAMAELGYHPNALARSLRRKKTHTLGMVVPDSANPFFAEVVRGIEDTVFTRDYSVILGNSDGDLAKELLYTSVLAEKQVDGILLVAVGATAEEHRQLLQNIRVPVVIVDRDVPQAAVDSVSVDNAHGGRLATRHLIQLGHRRIGCITGASNLTPSADRVIGYQQALAETNLPLDPTLIIKGDFQFKSGYLATRQMLAGPLPPTAIFACNDLMAVGAISAAIEAGCHIPGDLSVVGYDDVPLASFSNPPLTTVAQPKYKMGQLAATILLERLNNKDQPLRRERLDVELVVRQTTAPPHQRSHQ